MPVSAQCFPSVPTAKCQTKSLGLLKKYPIAFSTTGWYFPITAVVGHPPPLN
jgi:hypothetical protein